MVGQIDFHSDSLFVVDGSSVELTNGSVGDSSVVLAATELLLTQQHFTPYVTLRIIERKSLNLQS